MAELLPTEVALPTQPLYGGNEEEAVPVINCGGDMAMMPRPGDASPSLGGGSASPPAALGTGSQPAVDAEQIARKLKNHESITSSQIRNVEATFEQLLHQATSSLRKDIASREERLTRRMDSERKEQQTALLELRRDLTMQQTSDLATYEDRLSRRLDSERREQKTALAELRREIGAQQEHRVQIASLRRDLGTTQAALTKLAQSRGSVSVEESDLDTSSSGKKSGMLWKASLASSDGQLQSTTASEQSTSAITEAGVSELRREISELRDQLQMSSSAAEAALGALRKELGTSQAEEMRTMQEQLSRGTAEFSRNLQEIMGVVEASGNAVRAELRRDLETVRMDSNKQVDARVTARRPEVGGEGHGHRTDGAGPAVPPLQIASGPAGGSMMAVWSSKGSKSPTGGSAVGSVGSGGASVTLSAAAGAPSEGADVVALRSAVQGLEARVDGASQNIITLGRELSEHQQRISVAVTGAQLDVGRLAEEFAAQMTRSAAVQDNASHDIKCLATELAQQRVRYDEMEKSIADMASQASKAVQAAASVPQSSAMPMSTKRMDEDQVREISASVVKDVEAASKKVLEELLNHMMQMEAAVQRSVGTMDSNIDEVRSKMSHLGEDIARERDERCSALAGISCRAEDAADMAKKVTEELHALGKRLERGSPKHSEVASAEMDSVSERAARMAGGRPTPPESAAPPGFAGFPDLQPGSLEHNALAACLGEMDAELRMELSAKLKTVRSEFSRELDRRIADLEKQIGEGTFGDPALKKLLNRVQILEDSRLDLRIGALESAAHHGAVFSVAAVQAAAAEQALAKAAQAEKELSELDMSRPAAATPKAAAVSAQERADEAERLQQAEQRIQERIEARLDGKLDALTRSTRRSVVSQGEVAPSLPKVDVERVEQSERQEHVDLLQEVRNAHEALSSLAALREGATGANSSEEQGGDGWQLSDQLKERLDVLVQQVKATLRDNPPESPGASSQCSRAMSAVIPSMATSRLMANLGFNVDSSRGAAAAPTTQVVNVAPHSNRSLSTTSQPAPVAGIGLHESMPTIGTLVEGLATGGSAQYNHPYGSSISVTPAQPPPMVVSHSAAAPALGSFAMPTLGAMQTTVSAPPEPMHSVVPTNVTVSGPPILKSIYVSEAQRRPHSPLRTISPVRQRDSASPVRGASPVRQREVSPVRFGAAHGGTSPVGRARDISPTRLAQMPPLQVASTATLASAAPVLTSPGAGQFGQETPRTASAAFASSWFNVRR